MNCRFKLPLLAGFFALTGCVSNNDTAWPDKPGKKVLTTFAPIQCFTRNVVGDDGQVKSLLTTKGPHDHGDPSPNSLKLAAKADVLFINGLTIDDNLGGQIKRACGNPDFNLVDLSKLIDENCLLEGACHHAGGHAPGEDHDHGHDPHVWLSPRHARTMVAGIRDEMKRIDPEHAANYDSRAAAYIAKLEKLEKDGIDMLKDKKERKIIAFHDSLRYFGQTFGITVADFIQIEPGVEPTGDELKNLIKLCRKDGIRIIAVEPQFPRNTSAATILNALRAAEIDAQFVEIDPLETADESELTPDFYERKMRSNLENLAKALK